MEQLLFCRNIKIDFFFLAGMLRNFIILRYLTRVRGVMYILRYIKRGRGLLDGELALHSASSKLTHEFSTEQVVRLRKSGTETK